MSTKFTPGPWKAHFEEAYYVTGPDLGRVAMMMNLKGRYGLGGRRTGEEAAANARLIAAAPAMYEALEQIKRALLTDTRQKSIIGDGVEYHLDGQIMGYAINAARAALALARGEA